MHMKKTKRKCTRMVCQVCKSVLEYSSRQHKRLHAHQNTAISS